MQKKKSGDWPDFIYYSVCVCGFPYATLPFYRFLSWPFSASSITFATNLRKAGELSSSSVGSWHAYFLLAMQLHFAIAADGDTM